ncbi:MAG: anti-sigma factor RsbA family regulatory protein [Nocardioidaceae bacterium]
MGATPTGSAFSHSVLLHSSDEELLQTVVPFLRAGLDAGESAVVCCTPPTTELLQGSLGHQTGIAYLDYDETYSTPITAIAAYLEVVDNQVSSGAEHVRVIGQMTSDGSPDDHVEWARYEAVANRAMASYPVSAICIYDAKALSADVVAFGRFTHPTLISGSVRTPNPDCVDPSAFLRRMTQATPDPLEATPPDVEFVGLVSLDKLRLQLESCLFQRTHMAQEAADLVLAVNEIATNALRHARPPVDVRLWVRSDRFLCTVVDHGPGISDPFAGYIWPGALSNMPTCGMGLWLARRLCDRVDIFDSPQGFTVRLNINRGHTSPHPIRHQDASG